MIQGHMFEIQRPTGREVDKRLKEAKEALKSRRVAFANLPKCLGELMRLEIGDADEVWDLLLDLLEEITIGDYAGGRPPQKNTEPDGTGAELYAFCWNSHRYGKRMYLKFAIKDGTYYYVSLHESRIKKEL